MNGFKSGYYGFGNFGLEAAVAEPVEMLHRLVHGEPREGGIYGEEVGYAGLVFRVERDEGIAVGDRALEFFHYDGRIVHYGHEAVGVGIGLAHLHGRILKAHNAGAEFGYEALRDLKGLPIGVVEAYGYIPRDLDVLLLIRADRHKVALIKQYVACHQHRVGEKAGVYIVRVLCGFILELRHSGELAHIGVAAQHPVKLSVLVNVGLHKQYGFFGIYAAGQQQRHSLAGPPSQVGGILTNGQSVKIGDAVVAEPVIGLQELPIFERTNIIAQSW